MQKITFDNKKSLFFRALKTRVDAYFKENDIHASGNKPLYLKAGLLVATAITLYVVLVFFTPPVPLALFLCALMGINLAAIGFNVMHEGGHQTFSKYTWLNHITAYFLNVLGGNSYFWKIKHNQNHHTFTNIEGHDGDIDVKPFLRMSENQPKYWFHRFQHVYWVILYGISYFAWIYFQDFQKYFSGRIVDQEKVKLSLKEHLVFWFTKIAYSFVYLGIPILILGWLPVVVGFGVLGISCGLFLSIVFQLAHVTESTQFPEPDSETQKIPSEWAVHQMATTANFGTSSKLLYWLLGGLNFQVEHHLFPRVSHIHYPKINEIVKQTSAEFDVPYLEYPSMTKALNSHLIHLRKMGTA